MMKFLYTLGILIYSFIIRCISPFNNKAKLWYEGRKQLNFDTLKSFKGCILVQCSSLGEFEQAQPLIHSLKIKFPKKKIVLTFFSPSGYELKKSTNIVDKVIYLPIDTPWHTNRFVKTLQPELAFFIKYDFWPNLYVALKKHHCKIYLISTIFRPNQAFFKWYGKWYKKTLHLVDYFFVQNEESKHLLSSLDLNNSIITGDTRFDQVLNIKSEPFSDNIIEAFTNHHQNIVIAGSTWLQDEQIILDCILEYPEWKWIIAPHEINEPHIKALIQVLKDVKSIRYTQASSITDFNNTQVLIVDTIGVLKYLYRYGQIAYIGGGFGKSIHNTLEPAVYGVPVLFGPKYHKFQEAKDLISQKIGFEINSENIKQVFNSVKNEQERQLISERTDKYIQKQKGSINKIMNYLT